MLMATAASALIGWSLGWWDSELRDWQDCGRTFMQLAALGAPQLGFIFSLLIFFHDKKLSCTRWTGFLWKWCVNAGFLWKWCVNGAEAVQQKQYNDFTFAPLTPCAVN